MPDSTRPLSRNRDFQLLWSGQALSALGSRVSAIAFPLLVFATTGSAAKAGVVLFAGTLPLLVFTLPAGVLVDRLDRKRVMVACDATRAVALGSIPIAIGFDRLTFAHVVAVAAIDGVGYTLFDVADRAALRHVVPFEQLPAAVARIQAREYAAILLGKPLGGLLFGLGRTLPFVFDAISYALSVVTVLLIRPRLQEPRVAPRRHLVAEVGEGVSWLARHRILRTTSLLSAASDTVLNALFLVVIVAAARRGGSSLEIGTAMAFIGVGGLLGAVLSTRLAPRLSIRAVVVGSLAIVAGLLPVLAVAPHPLLIGAVYGAMFVPFPTWNAVVGAYQLAVVPDRLQARVRSVQTLLNLGTVPFSALLVGFALDRVSPSAIVVAFSAVMAVVVGVAVTSRAIRRTPRFNELGPQEARGDDAVLALA
jgi:MFS family permease